MTSSDSYRYFNQSSQLRAGVARVEITKDNTDDSVHDPLYARALVLDYEAVCVAIVALDTTAICGRSISDNILNDVGEDFLPSLRSRIERELQIPSDNIMVHATHTHPPGRLLCNDDEQIERTFQAVRTARNHMQPVTIGAGTGREDRISMNRTLRLKDGRHWTVRQTNPCPPDEEIDGMGPVDYDIGILRIDRINGKPLAIVYNFACHPLLGVAGGAITADYPGFASKVLEDALGNDTFAIFLQGAAGDIAEVLYKGTHCPRNAEPIGTMLGISTLHALPHTSPMEGILRVTQKTVALPRRTDIPKCMEQLHKEQAILLKSLRGMSLNFRAFLPLYLQYALNPDYPADYAYRYIVAQATGDTSLSSMDSENRDNIERYLQNIQTMERLAHIQDDLATLQKHQKINNESRQPTILAQVQGIRIGQCVLIACPIELLCKVGLRLKQISPFEYTLIAAYSNGYMHYGPPPEYYNKGGYEVTECLLAPEWYALFEKTVQDIYHDLI